MSSDDRFPYSNEQHQADAEHLPLENAAFEDAVGALADKATAVRDSETAGANDAVDPYQAFFARQTESGAIRFVRSFLKHKGIQVLFDGSMRYLPAPKPADIDQLEWEMRPAPDECLALEELTDASASGGLNFKAAELRRALRRVVSDERRHRKAQIVALLETRLNEEQKAHALEKWRHLECLFEMNGSLCAVVLMHLVWLVKRKLRNLTVTNHLMPIVTGAVQGSGKTTFVEKFVAPLDDLGAHGVLLSDLADARSGEIFSYPLVFVDDVATLNRRAIETLKSVITGKQIARRRLGTSRSTNFAQSATFIGTANKPAAELIGDPTGHRRFVDLPFRNGNVHRGGDEAVWPIVQQMDALLLWQSIDANEASPLEAHLNDLAAWEESNRPRGEVEHWLEGLDTGAPEVRTITMPHGVMAERLWKLFGEQADSDLSKTKWGEQMKALFGNPRLPFAKKIKTAAGWFYVPRATK